MKAIYDRETDTLTITLREARVRESDGDAVCRSLTKMP